MKFRDLLTEESFHLDACVETGLITLLGTPGRKVYKKVSARTYRDDTGLTIRVGSVNAHVWPIT